ncbi:GHMP family kinase ATP-binding protein [Micromonospora sp. URMC 105]|uniref:GHMP family kinase ATP-binding protein n=1 Tax=Micromonospora sp. URMC 105 TaxID=3423413 RepID=UPI003F1D2410
MTDVMHRVELPAELRMVPYAFLQMFGSAPTTVSHAAGGCSLLNSSRSTLAVPVPWGAVAAAAPGAGDLLELRSRNRPAETVAVSYEAHPGRVPPWAVAPLAAARAMRAGGFPVRGARLVLHTALPHGVAVSSTAAASAATAVALADVYGVRVEPAELSAVLAGGSVDLRAAVLAALTGGQGKAVSLRADGTITWLPCDLAAAGLRLFVVETSLAADGLPSGSHRPAPTPADGGTVSAGDPGQGEADPVVRAARLLRAGRPAALGALLTSSWRAEVGRGLRPRLHATAGVGDDGLAGALGEVAAAALRAGALGVKPVGEAGLLGLLRATDMPAVRAAVGGVLAQGRRPPRLLTATPAERLVLSALPTAGLPD